MVISTATGRVQCFWFCLTCGKMKVYRTKWRYTERYCVANGARYIFLPHSLALEWNMLRMSFWFRGVYLPKYFQHRRTLSRSFELLPKKKESKQYNQSFTPISSSGNTSWKIYWLLVKYFKVNLSQTIARVGLKRTQRLQHSLHIHLNRLINFDG